MGATSVIGAQWGDEGKGKIVAMLANKADAVVRYHGGNNAGHTLYHNGQRFASHLVPSGMFNPNAKLFIGRGTVLDLAVLGQEIDDLKTLGVDLTGRLFVSPGCHIIMSYHNLLDGLYEDVKGLSSTGTTRRGIGPAHADKVSYNGIRLLDLYDRKALIEKLAIQMKIKNRIIKGLGGGPLDTDQAYHTLISAFDKLKAFICEPRSLLLKMIQLGRNVLFEGAHGVLLDNDWGTYPFVTASSVVVGSINAGAGIPDRYVNQVIGVTKAYQTRVGNGPFPTELLGTTGDRLREVGQERGTTTGRDRRCGWLDLLLLRYAVEVAGITELAVTKLDVLDDFDEIKVCTDYNLFDDRGHVSDPDDLSAVVLAQVRPLYDTFRGWKQSTKLVRKFGDLPHEAQIYLHRISSFVGVPIRIVSIGPNEEDTILV